MSEGIWTKARHCGVPDDRRPPPVNTPSVSASARWAQRVAELSFNRSDLSVEACSEVVMASICWALSQAMKASESDVRCDGDYFAVPAREFHSGAGFITFGTDSVVRQIVPSFALQRAKYAAVTHQKQPEV